MLKSAIKYILLLLLIPLVSCDSGKDPGATDSHKSLKKHPINVVASVGMVADIVRNVGGEMVAVDQLINHGVDPHLYRATRDDIAKIMRADLVFYNGLLLEGKMQEVFGAASLNGRAFPFSDFFEIDKLLDFKDDPKLHFDPHLWMDVSIWARMPQRVADILSEKDPEHKDLYRKNAELLETKLNSLHEYGREIISKIALEKRILISSHDAFQYFGKAYHIEVHGVQGLSTDSEAGLVRINELVDLVVKRRVLAVFVESSVSPKTIQALVEGAKSRQHQIKIGGTLYTDAMGPEGSDQGTYEGMMRHNFDTLYEALGQ